MSVLLKPVHTKKMLTAQSNSDGSYSCTCKLGFTGDGTTCKDTLNFWTLKSSLDSPFNSLY